MADKRISQLIERTDIANNDVLPIVASGATTTNKVTISTIQDWMQGNLDLGVTSVGITLGSSGTDVNVTGSPITTSGNITINIPTASATNRGLLSSADWVTFNSKQDAGNFVTLDTAQTITAQKTFTTSGSSDSVIISHGSGSGIALDVIKAGNSEAIRIQKTSGSGNAVTITGGLLSAENATFSNTITAGNDIQLVTVGSALNTFIKNINATGLTSIGSNGFGFNNSNNIYFSGSSKGGGIFAFNNTGNQTYTLQNASGTLAFTSDLGNYIQGFGTADSIPKFTGDRTIANSAIRDTTSTVVISKNVSVDNGASQAINLSPASGGTTNRIETTGTLPLAIITSGSSITLAAGGSTPQITLATTGAVTFANSITINTPSNGIGVLLNGRTSDNFSSIRFGANTGGGQYNTISANASSFAISSQGNTPITFGTNTSGGGGTRVTIGGDGAVTLTGALSGTTANFSGSTFVGGGISSNVVSQAITFDTKNILYGNLTIGQVPAQATLGVGASGIVTEFPASTAITIKSTGAATFSSSVTADKLVVSKGGAEGMEFDAGTIIAGRNFIINYNRSTSAYTDFQIDANNIFLGTAGYLRMASGSGGIQFNGDTAAANALDDYEEGTWTPTYVGSGGGSMTHSIQNGQYTKIGNVVHINFYIQGDKDSLSGDISISGLPFAVAETTLVNLTPLRRFITDFIAYGALSSTSILLRKLESNSLTPISVTDSDLSSATTLYNTLGGSFTYFI
jgi:hypothetical protein